MKNILLVLAITGATCATLVGAYTIGDAHAQTLSDAGPAPAGSAASLPATTADPTPVTAPVPSASDQLHDPLGQPVATINDLTAAKRTGWVVFIFALAVIIARLLGKAASVPWLSWLGKGKAAVVVGGLVALAGAGYNALASGGSIYAALTAIVMTGLALWNSHTGVTS